MKLSKQQMDVIIKNSTEQGISNKDLFTSLYKKGYEIEGVDTNQAKSELGLSQPVEQVGQDTMSPEQADKFLNKSTIGQIFSKETAKELPKAAYDTLVGNAAKFVKSAVETPVNIVQGLQGKEMTTANINDPVTGKPIGSFQTDFQDKILPAVESGEISPLKGTAQAVGGPVLGALDVLGAVSGEKVIKKVADATAPVLKKGLNIAEDLTKSSVNQVANVVEDAPDILSKFIAPNVDDKFKTALKRTTKQEVSDMETIVKNATQNADNPSAFEVVGNKIADATEQVNSQVKSLAQKKKNIIGKAKNGNVDFTNETRKVILDINRSLKDSTIGKQFISKLKSVKTKFQADQAIDELQDILYKGNKDLTIPTGSKEDKVLKGILGKYNSSLKEGLPASYKKINEEISKKLSSLELLNKSLGEVVDGVPIKGASLIKQYFSPSGTKAKELFEFIQKNTGYDVGKDAVLAKYMSEIYGETRARSLLQGIPTTAQGTIDKLIDFTLKKTGASDILEKATTRGSVLKAKDLAN